jgi:hypothetical protein
MKRIRRNQIPVLVSNSKKEIERAEEVRKARIAKYGINDKYVKNIVLASTWVREELPLRHHATVTYAGNKGSFINQLSDS